MLMALGTYAQKQAINQLLDGKINKEQFADAFVQHFDAKYTLTRAQVGQLNILASRKANHYSEIANLKSDKALYERKLAAQDIHTMQSLRSILTKDQYKSFMTGYRVEKAKLKKAKVGKKK